MPWVWSILDSVNRDRGYNQHKTNDFCIGRRQRIIDTQSIDFRISSETKTSNRRGRDRILRQSHVDKTRKNEKRTVSPLWENLTQEYVTDLEKFHCPAPCKTKQVKIGQVVIFDDEYTTRPKWKTARVAKSNPGSENKFRRVAVQIAD